MAHSIDAFTQRKLVLVKQLYQQGVVQSANLHGAVAKIMAVIGFDLAVESLLKAIVGSLDSSKTPVDSFQALVQQADSLLSNLSSG